MWILRSPKIKFLALIILIILLWSIGRHFNLTNEKLEQFLSGYPLVLSGIIFVLFYVVITFFFWLAKDVLRLFAAFFFGAWISTLFIYIAETINALVLFSLSRALGRQFIEDYCPQGLKGIDNKIANTSFPWLILLRAAPLLPFRFLDLAAGLTSIPLKKYITAVIIGSPVRIFWVQFIFSGVGKAVLKDPLALSDYLLANKAAFIFSFIYLILAIFAAVKLRKE